MTEDERDVLLRDMAICLLAILKATAPLVPDPKIQAVYMGAFDSLNQTLDDIQKAGFDDSQPCTCGGIDDGLHSKHCRKRGGY